MIEVPLQPGVSLERALHVSRGARERYGVTTSLVDLRGRVLILDPYEAERLAAAMNAHRRTTGVASPEVHGADILAAGILDEAMHLMLDAYRRRGQRDWTARLTEQLSLRLGDDRFERAQRAFLDAFPPLPVVAGDATIDVWLRRNVGELPAREVAIEERILVRIANENPALSHLRELLDDRKLGDEDAAWIELMQTQLENLPGLEGMPGADDLWTMLRAPFLKHPTSLEQQLAFVRDAWGVVLGPAFQALLTRLGKTLGMLAELHAGAPPGPPGPAPVLTLASLRGPMDEPEAYSADADWMPQVVLLAKNTYVWLEQLSRWMGRDIRRLDQIPDEVLAEVRRQGFTGLWLIGLWERSEASVRIKRMRGQEDAVASAYALHDYVIAETLGGEEAWAVLRDQAARFGIRLAADMVPNHVGIDGRWVIEHPNWFISLDHPPYPDYRFTGPNLSGDGRIEVRIEDGYWDHRDAAVVFERRETGSGEVRYLYHGNDGTSMPWNDTAQLDYLKPEVREAVMNVIVDVARKFPIIRFDAAMTLAKKHIQRLWFPPPGEGGAIPSRSAYGTRSVEDFEAAMPEEFWREVVERVARDAPGTLLLAEAFWMMEGYFVRSLGMHRVYNSAFMNMLAREANAEYQELMRNVLAFDSKVLARFVNFMNNPDEETAIHQFGDGDKAFGVATLLSTLPGLPMFGHGQVEGLREKYGMEYHRAKQAEEPNPHLMARHQAEIAPLLARRATFAGTERFRLFEVVTVDGLAHDTFAYSNHDSTGKRALIVVQNRYAEVDGRLHQTVPWRDASEGELRRESVADALGLQGGEDRFVRYQDMLTGKWHLARSDEWRNAGIEVRLGAYGRRVWLDMEEVRDLTGDYARLERELEGRGVMDLEEALEALRLRPVHASWQALVAGSPVGAPVDRELAEVLEDALSSVLGSPPRGGRWRLDHDALERYWKRADILVAPEGPTLGWLRSCALLWSFNDPDVLLADARLELAVSACIDAERFDLDADEAKRNEVQDVAPEAASDEPGEVELESPSSGAEDEREAEQDSAEQVDDAHDEPPSAALEMPVWAKVSSVAWAALWRHVVLRVQPLMRDLAMLEDAEESVRVIVAAGARDPDVELVLHVHEHEGTRWFRQEGFIAWWRAVRVTLQMNGVDADAASEVERIARGGMNRSGFEWDSFLGAFSKPQQTQAHEAQPTDEGS